MRTHSSFWRLAIAGALCLAIWACDNKAGPTPNPQSQNPQLELSGPATVAPGASAQYTARVRLRDGTRQDVTAHVSWRSANPAVLGMSEGGLATGAGNGEVVVTAVYNAINASTSVIVVPVGTYRLTGTITEGGSNASVGGALVEAIRNGDTVVGTTTDGSGAYRLYGVPGNAQLRITRDGYLPSTTQLSLTGHVTRNVSLIRTGSALDLTGRYTLTVNANGTCQSFGAPGLPADMTRRTYTADITQSGLDVLVTLSGASFAQNSSGLGDHFRGTVNTTGATFRLNEYWNWYYYNIYPDVVERLPNGNMLVLDGTATTTASASGLSGTLNGEVVQLASDLNSQWIGYCSSRSFQFSLTK